MNAIEQIKTRWAKWDGWSNRHRTEFKGLVAFAIGLALICAAVCWLDSAATMENSVKFAVVLSAIATLLGLAALIVAVVGYLKK